MQTPKPRSWRCRRQLRKSGRARSRITTAMSIARFTVPGANRDVYDSYVAGLKKREPADRVCKAEHGQAPGHLAKFGAIQGRPAGRDAIGDLLNGDAASRLPASSSMRSRTSWRLRRRYAFREAASRATAYPAARYALAPFSPLAMLAANFS